MPSQARRYVVNSAIQTGKLLAYFGLHKPRFSAQQLITAAMEMAGFDQWGDPELTEPLERLCDDLQQNANLHLPGHIATRFDLLRLLQHRLGIEQLITDQPEIAEQPTIKPIFVVGLPRTGTTMLHNLLSQDNQHRAPLTWETMQPLQATATQRSQHTKIQQRVASQLKWLDGLVPDFHRIHAVAHDLPQECLVITAHSLHSYQFQTTHHVPNYQSWLEQQSRIPAYRYHQRFLQHLQWQSPAQRWVLKAPAHLFGLNDLLKIYPDACIIQTHREPTEVMSSLASLTTSLRSAFSHQHDAHQIGIEVNQRWSKALNLALQCRDQQQLPEERLFDVDYHQFIADPQNILKQIYAHFELDWQPQTEQNIQSWLANNPKSRHGKHQHTLADFGLQADHINEHFQVYRQRFLEHAVVTA